MEIFRLVALFNMKKLLHIISLFILVIPASAQLPGSTNTVPTTEMVFISDTQQPMWVETILLKSNNNRKATGDIFAEILQRKPESLYMLGDVVALGYSNKKWRKVDRFLDSCRSIGITVFGILGNHEVLTRSKKGERNFEKRFPKSIRTGYVSVTDSVAVVLLNSNFNRLSAVDISKEKKWYEQTMAALDTSTDIKSVIVTCHHAPYSNSKVVKGSQKVQEYFVPGYLKSKKAQLFITGHAHAFEHFNMKGKDFLVIGGGGGLHQPLHTGSGDLKDLAPGYKPMFHYLSVQRLGDKLLVTSHYLNDNFTGFATGHTFETNTQSNLQANL